MDGFGERLRKLRRDKDITQNELAEYLEVVPSAVGKYERVDGAYPSVTVLIKLADYFNVSIDYLLRGTKNNPLIENNINGSLENSPFIQANRGGVIFNGDRSSSLSPEAGELLHIYDALDGRGRLQLLNFAVELEGGVK